MVLFRICDQNNVGNTGMFQLLPTRLKDVSVFHIALARKQAGGVPAGGWKGTQLRQADPRP